MFSLHRVAIALVLMCWAPIVAAQSAYPTKPIHMVVPLAAGSAVDNAMRILTQRMSENMGQGIVVDNQPGAAGLIGAERVAKAAPDGYTIGGFNDSIMTMLPNLHAKLSWDILKDFEPVSLVATVEWGLVTSNDSPSASPSDTSIQDSIDRMNQQMAADAANAAAQQQFLAGMAAAQETMNNANNNQATSNW